MCEEKVLRGRCIVEGCVEGEALVTNDAISFMGTINPKTGYVIERKHEIEGACLKGKVLVFPVGPLGIVTIEAESIVVIGAIVSDLPMVDRIDIGQIHTGDYVRRNSTEGTVTVIPKQPKG